MVGNIQIGGGAAVSVQSMTNVPANNIDGILEQIISLEKRGCDIVRIAVPDEDSTDIFIKAKEEGIKIPLVADVHFDYKIALQAVKKGASKIRINPGNIGEMWKMREVADACRLSGIPIRVGVNGGSLDKKLLLKYSSPTPEALAESALTQAEVLEKSGFSDIVIGVKSSSVRDMIKAARIVAESSSYPLHLGVTEAGDGYSGVIKNAVGIGALLADGIGDTIRVSLTADPLQEVDAAKEILKSLDLTDGYIDIVSCPTCGRTNIDLIPIVNELRSRLSGVNTHGLKIKIAVMGCIVNGIGEGKEADFGIAGGDGKAALFRKGELVRTISENDIISALIEETESFINDRINKGQSINGKS